jgi:CubicO group peptidase (beta-lactamase class C family)
MRPTLAPNTPAAAATRNYWPTAGWRTATPEEQGMDPARLAAVDDQVATAYPHVRSVLVVRHGYLVYEHYRSGLDEKSGHDVRSVTKSVVGALVGIALAEGRIASPDQPVAELLPTPLSEGADPRFATVTVRHLLTMTSGLAGDDAALGGDPRAAEAMWTSSNWVRHILDQTLVTDPGTTYAYNDATAHLLSAIVANVADQSTLEYAREKLFTPLGIPTEDAFEPMLGKNVDTATLEDYERSGVAWPVDPQGFHFGGAFLRLPARDLAKFGFLYLNGGRWDGQQVIPADYVAAATSVHGSSPNVTRGYGWLWWVGTEPYRAFFARGRGGQLIYVVPDLDMVLVVTSDPEAAGLDPKILITQTIVPAANR